MSSFWKILILLTSSILMSACHKQVEKQVEEVFRIPVIVQEKSEYESEFFKKDRISEVFPNLIGKGKCIDTLKISSKDWPKDTTIQSDFIEVVDGRYFETDGFEMYVDYSSSIKMRDTQNFGGNLFYPVYMVNETNISKFAILRNEYIYAIQEALDTNNHWYPIEVKGFLVCGSVWGLKIHPKEFFAFAMPKYEGDFKTMLRVRVKIKDNIYVSKPFEGTINPNQFYFVGDDFFNSSEFSRHGIETFQVLFFGAIPLEYKKMKLGLPPFER